MDRSTLSPKDWVTLFVQTFPGETFTVRDLHFWIRVEKFGPSIDRKVLGSQMKFMKCKNIGGGVFRNPGKLVKVDRLSNEGKFDNIVAGRIQQRLAGVGTA